MISRRGTRTSGASSGVTKILREGDRGPVVTAGSVVSGLERMFISYPPVIVVRHSGRSAGRGPIRNLEVGLVARDSGFALRAPQNDAGIFCSPSRGLRVLPEPGAHARVGVGIL